MKLNKNKIITARVKSFDPNNVSDSVSEIKLFIKETEEDFEDTGNICNDYGVLFAPGSGITTNKMTCIFNLFDDNSGLLILLISIDPNNALFGMSEFKNFKKQLLEELS